MKGIDELDHYELFEVRRSATAREIDRAYQVAQQTYADGSLALYSVFEASEAAAIRMRLDEAYRVLSDPELRDQYDQENLDSRGALRDPGPPVALSSDAQGRALHVAERYEEDLDRRSLSALDEQIEDYDAFEDEDGGDFDGVRLRRSRLFRGYELDDISGVTKVNPHHLRNIEEENFSALPADVYVRGFVTAYAKSIGLDPKIVVPSYMARVQSSRAANQRGRFLARR
jgi:curved DNA-binding protein CbpA